MPGLAIAAGLRLFYQDFNPGGDPPVLLVHGLGASSESWAGQIPALVQAGFRAIAPDLRGFGRSNFPGGRVDVAILAGDLADLLREIGSGPAHVVGVSMGGAVAVQLALDRPELVRRLALVNTFARFSLRRPALWLYFGLRLLTALTLGVEAQARSVCRHVFSRPEQEPLREILYGQIVQADPRAYRQIMLALARFDVHHRLAEIRSPTLVITGELDDTVPPEIQLQLVAGIPGARHVVIPGAGHGVTAEQPEAFNGALLDFLL